MKTQATLEKTKKAGLHVLGLIAKLAERPKMVRRDAPGQDREIERPQDTFRADWNGRSLM